MLHTLAVDLTKQLIQIESTDPGTYEGAIEKWIKDWFLTLEKHALNACPGISEGSAPAPLIRLTEEEVLPGRFNLMAELPGNDADAPALVWICHMDTVVAGSGWTLPPFGGTEKDRRIYGRGSCDMKSGLACCLSAFSHALHQQTTEGSKPVRTLKLICTVDEEDFMRGSEHCIRSAWVTEKDWIIDAEPTNGQIQVAHKGRTWYEIEVTGHTAHASTPWKGADAIAAIAEVIRSIRLDIQNAPTHPDLGMSTVTFGQITGGYRPYVVPDSAKVWIDMRLVPPLDTSAANKIVENAIHRAKKEVPGITASYTITGNRPYVEKEESSPLLKCLTDVCRTVTQKEPVISHFPGYTDTAVIAGTLNNHNCMSYGPGNLECAHQPDEWVAIEDILRCEKVYCKMTEWL
ncbi:M20 family metallopeptidase [Mediterraneibacter agrestimuris]|uniref:M20 family metallopeptidase n=1 Tax=Mediterraneibacter agrestimuris TaxID=2941333 RepID=UPI00203CA88E|nr:M20 family metallopeptidase [Mediterraneibacter agrestimuris]